MPATESSNNTRLRRHDFIVSVIVWCLSLATFIESWRLTFHLSLPGVDEQKAWLVAPGIFPLVLSAGLLLMFSVLLFVSYKEGEFKGHFSVRAAQSLLNDPENLMQVVQISLLCLYVFGLLGRVHFGVASAIYLFSAMFAARAASWPILLLIAILFSALVSYVFGTLMKIPLP